MTFELKTKPIMAIYSPSAHKLETAAVKQWWQVATFLKLLQRRTQDPFRNDAMRTAASFLITCPIGVAYMLCMALPTAAAQHTEFLIARLVFLAALVWLSQAYMFLRAGKKHIHIVHEVIATEDGLDVRAPFFKRKIGWCDISDIFQVGNVDSGYDMYELDCNNGESIFLSCKLTDSYRLFELIENKLGRKPRPSFQLNYRLADGFVDGIPMAVSAIFIAVIFSLLKSWTLPTLQEGAMIAALLGVTFAIGWFFMNKVPQLVRYGHAEIYIRTRTQTRLIAWEHVRQIQRFGSLMILKTRSNWFAILVSKGEPLNDKLQCRATRIAAERCRVIS